MHSKESLVLGRVLEYYKGCSRMSYIPASKGQIFEMVPSRNGIRNIGNHLNVIIRTDKTVVKGSLPWKICGWVTEDDMKKMRPERSSRIIETCRKETKKSQLVFSGKYTLKPNESLHAKIEQYTVVNRTTVRCSLLNLLKRNHPKLNVCLARALHESVYSGDMNFISWRWY